MSHILKHKDESEQDVELVYGPFSEEGGFHGKPMIKYNSPMAVVKLIGVDIEKPWSFKTVPIKFVIKK